MTDTATMTTEEMIRKALERPLVECSEGAKCRSLITQDGDDAEERSGARVFAAWQSRCPGGCNGTGQVREPLAQAVLDALAVVVELGHHYHPYWRDHSLCLGTKLGPGCVLHPGDGKDCHGTGYVPRTVDLNDRVSVAEACGRLYTLVHPEVYRLVSQVNLEPESPYWAYQDFGQALSKSDYTSARDALGRLLEALWGVEVEA